ncbi:MAG: cytochrome c3 family protein [Nitrospiraceae bacterium]|nr:cytochrome c3 family protein [Nitrospiraceae bacterium]
MKKIIVLVAAFLLVASSAFATIANTKHNLTTAGTGITKTTVATATLCGFCHIPHGGSTATTGLPLWARAIPATGSYQVYGSTGVAGTSVTLSGTTINAPGTFSLTCLSCHDGSIGLGTITKNGVPSSYAMTSTLPGGLTAGGAFQATNIDPVTGYSPYIGANLQNDHPVGFQYPTAGYGAGGGIPGISVVLTSGSSPYLTGGTTATHYPLFNYGVGNATTFECASCHEPHLEPVAGQTKFLRAANATLCQDCHNTK